MLRYVVLNAFNLHLSPWAYNASITVKSSKNVYLCISAYLSLI